MLANGCAHGGNCADGCTIKTSGNISQNSPYASINDPVKENLRRVVSVDAAGDSDRNRQRARDASA